MEVASPAADFILLPRISFTIAPENNLKFKTYLTCIAKPSVFFRRDARNFEAIDREYDFVRSSRYVGVT